MIRRENCAPNEGRKENNRRESNSRKPNGCASQWTKMRWDGELLLCIYLNNNKNNRWVVIPIIKSAPVREKKKYWAAINSLWHRIIFLPLVWRAKIYFACDGGRDSASVQNQPLANKWAPNLFRYARFETNDKRKNCVQCRVCQKPGVHEREIVLLLFRAHLDHIIWRKCTVATHFEFVSICLYRRLWARTAYARPRQNGNGNGWWHRTTSHNKHKNNRTRNDNDNDDTQKSVRRAIKIAHNNRRSGSGSNG